MKKKTTLTIEENLIKLAKNRKLNISEMVEKILEKELFDDKKIYNKSLELASTCQMCKNKFDLDNIKGTDNVFFDEKENVLIYDVYCIECGEKEVNNSSLFQNILLEKVKLQEGKDVLKSLMLYLYSEKLDKELSKLKT